jgi:fructokinase
MPEKNVVCFGEVLWDLLPSGKVAGGAPMNVAYHLNNFGVETQMVSRVGEDELGKQLLAFLNQKGVSTQLVQRDPEHPTGIVQVTMREGGFPEYEIVENVAWDFIALKDNALQKVEKSDLFVFGSLAARHETSKNTLLELVKKARFKVFDINLRPPFYQQVLLEQLLSQADIVKVNDEELEIVAGWYGQSGSETDQLTFVLKQCDLSGIILTKGAKGAVFLDEDGLHEQSGFPVEVEDTIGSGDSFLAGFLSRYLKGEPPKDCLAFAGATGAMVATHRGATPLITEDAVKRFMAKRR